MKKKKERKWDHINPISSIRNLLGEACNIPVIAVKRSDGANTQYDSSIDTYLISLLVQEYLHEMKTHFVDVMRNWTVPDLHGILN